MKKKLIAVIGPTAGGKSALALKIAKKFGAYLLSADSRQVYKGLDIGTNKDLGVWRDKVFFVDGIAEYLIDTAEPDENYTVENWRKEVRLVIKKRGSDLPILVGGTGFYLSAIIDNFSFPDLVTSDLREALQTRLNVEGPEELIKEMLKIDPLLEEKVDLRNPRRLLRSAEILFATNLPLPALESKPIYDVLQIGVCPDREVLYKKIDQRVDQMLNLGLLEEVRSLMARGFTSETPAMTGIGYRQLVSYLNGEISLERAIELIKRDSRRYAKRQLTWFKRDPRIHWVKTEKEAFSLVKEHLK